jgi:hypothetical protein
VDESRRTSPIGGARLLGQGRARRLELPLLSRVPGLAHAFTVKGSEAQAVAEAALGAPATLHTLRQRHGAEVRCVRNGRLEIVPGDPPTGAAGAGPAEGDALITDRPGTALGVWVADCVPILVCDERTRSAAAVHAGWRGTVAGVLGAAIRALHGRFGARPSDLRVGLGPCIGACCFEVGDEVVEAILRADPGAGACVIDGPRRRVDLAGANRRQAVEAGVAPANLEAAGLCTVCRGDLLESHRGSRGHAGRMAALVAWRR